MTRSGLLAFDNWIVRPDTTVFSIDLSGTQAVNFQLFNSPITPKPKPPSQNLICRFERPIQTFVANIANNFYTRL